MIINVKLITRLGLMAVACSITAACVAVVPTPNSSNSNKTTASMCNIEGKQKQDLSDGTTKANVTQSCEETVIYVENQHKEHPKRCRVLIGGKLTELYIMPGENRTLTQTGPVASSTVEVACVNDWNRPK